MLEFGREIDLDTFERGFTAARGYFRQMLTLRTLVADSFWQGFSAGTGAFWGGVRRGVLCVEKTRSTDGNNYEPRPHNPLILREGVVFTDKIMFHSLSLGIGN